MGCTIRSRELANSKVQVRPVLLSGGSGTRLWPFSRRARPKQMLRLADHRTMLQATALRVANPLLFQPLTVVAAFDQADSVIAEMADISARLDCVVLEPFARNTAPAIALAALAGAEDDLMLVMPSDHVMESQGDFIDAIAASIPAAASGHFVTFGVRPDRPETGYGYIRRGPEVDPGIYEVLEFIEKPDAATAALYIAQGDFEWNAGIFLFKAGRFIAALERLAPDVAAACRIAMNRAERAGIRVLPDSAALEKCPSISIDHAILEHSKDVLVRPIEFSWSDVGSWKALYEISNKNYRGNAVTGDVLAIDSDNCLLRSEGLRVVAIGLDHVAVIATPDAVLVVPLSESQRVREAVEKLAAVDPKVL